MAKQSADRDNASTGQVRPGPRLALTRSGPSGPVLDFARHDDRHQHALRVAHPDRPVCLLESAETAAVPPASPPLQQLDRQAAGVAPVVFGVGQAGRHYWSATFEVGEPDRLSIHVACRSPEPLDWLGSTYRWHDCCQARSAGDCLVSLYHPDGIVRLESSGDCRVRIDPHSRELRIEPCAGQPDLWPATVQWQYSLDLSGWKAGGQD